MDRVIIVGAGGHAKVIIDILQQNKTYQIVGLIDKEETSGFWGIPILGKDVNLSDLKEQENVSLAFVALGNNILRERVSQRVLEAGYKLINVISSSAMISSKIKMGTGIAVMHGAIINADTEIGNGCIVNSNSSIDHECRIGEYTHIAPGVAISGGTKIGKGCFLGTGCRVIDKVKIGDDVVVGAGGVVINDIQSRCTVVGVPAQILRKK